MLNNKLRLELKRMAIITMMLTAAISLYGCEDKKKNKKSQKIETTVESVNEEETIGFKGTGYTIYTPNTWDDSKTENKSLDLMIYEKDITSDFARNLNVIIEDLSKYSVMDVDKYLDAASTKLVEAGYRVDETKDIEINGQKATSLIYSYSTNGYSIKGLQTYIFNDANKKMYIITYACSESEFDSHRADGEQIISTFKFD